ncbi:MAG: cysteine hydrolase [Thermotoga sp.]|nr:MAG: cysteine hydrolase [Thermotoga sp.]HDM70680.1 cysteine hydrolase [Thermotogales bacterium]
MRKKALLVIDVMKDFFEKGGKFYYPEAEFTIPVIRKSIELFRERKYPIFHIFDKHRSGKPDFEFSKLPEHFVFDDLREVAVLNDEIKESDYVIFKRRFSAFFKTDLDLILREENVREVFIVGCKTNVCIRATAQDAFQNGFKVFVISDGVSSNLKHLHEASLEDIERYIGEIITSKDLMDLLDVKI